MVCSGGNTDTGCEVEFPIGAEVQVNGRHDGLLLVAYRIEAGDGAGFAVVFDAEGDLFGNVVTHFDGGREGHALVHIESMPGAFQGRVKGKIPAAQLLVDDGANFPGPGVGGVTAALVANLGGKAHIDGPVPLFGGSHARTNMIAYPLIALAAAVAHEDIKAGFKPGCEALRDLDGFM